MSRSTDQRARRLIRALAILLMVGGALAVALPLGMRFWSYQTANCVVDTLERQRASTAATYRPVDYAALPTAQPVTYTEPELAQAAASDGLLDEVDGFMETDTTVADVLQTMTAQDLDTAYVLEIPSIALKVAALRATSFEDVYHKMRLGAAFFPKAPPLDAVGNACICAHRTGARDFFRNLDDVATGDLIYLHSASRGSYCYEVQTVGVVQPDDWSVTDATDEPVITLLSCQAYRGVSHGLRIRVRARLISVSPLAP